MFEALRRLVLEATLRATAFCPSWCNDQDFDTSNVRFDMIFGDSAEQ